MEDLVQFLRELMPKAIDWIIEHQNDEHEKAFPTIYPLVLLSLNTKTKALEVLDNYDHNELTIGQMLIDIARKQSSGWKYKRIFIGMLYFSFTTNEVNYIII